MKYAWFALFALITATSLAAAPHQYDVREAGATGDGKTLDTPAVNKAIETANAADNRFNAGLNYDGPRFIGAGSVNYSDKSFWTDVLSGPYHGYSDAYTLVNATFGVKWMQNKLATLVKINNLLNEDVQQHVFGDILKRMVVFEVKIRS